MTESTGNVANLEWSVFDTGVTPDRRLEATATPQVGQDLSINKRTLAPVRMTSYVPVSTRALIQATPSMEMIIRNNLALSTVQQIDKWIIDGSSTAGAAEVVRGVLKSTAPAITAVVGSGSPTANDGYDADWAWFTKVFQQVASSNALMGTPRFLLGPMLFSKLMRTEVTSGTSGEFIVDRMTRQLGGFPAMLSTNVPENSTKGTNNALSYAVFGDLSQILLAEWGAPNLMTNNSREIEQGYITIGIERHLNVGFMQDKAIVKSEQLANT